MYECVLLLQVPQLLLMEVAGVASRLAPGVFGVAHSGAAAAASRKQDTSVFRPTVLGTSHIISRMWNCCIEGV